MPDTIESHIPAAADTTVYRSLLGDSYDLLPTVLRRFHDLPEGQGEGILRVTHGAPQAARLLARLLRLPPACESSCVSLHVQTVGNVQVWRRTYGELLMVTRQWERGGLLIEQAGPYRVGFRLTAHSENLRFEFVRAWLGVFPIPRRLALSIEAKATASSSAECWRIDVRLSAPLLGMIARYEGDVRPIWKQP